MTGSTSNRRISQFRLEELPRVQTDGDVSEGENHTLSKKRRRLSPATVISSSSGLKSLQLPQAIEYDVRAYEYIRQEHDSPWKTYRKDYLLRLGLGDRVLVAEQRAFPYDVVVVRQMVGPDMGKKIALIQQLRHGNIVSPITIFRHQQSVSVVFEHIPISLFHLAGNPKIDETRLAAILGQILAGLVYLHQLGFQHGSLSCSNVLVDRMGVVKISDQECCCAISAQDKSLDIRSLRIITMEVMEGYSKEDDLTGVNDLKRWPLDSRAVDFLSNTTTATSLDDLVNHPLLRQPWQKEQLKSLVEYAMVAVGRSSKLLED